VQVKISGNVQLRDGFRPITESSYFPPQPHVATASGYVPLAPSEENVNKPNQFSPHLLTFSASRQLFNIPNSLVLVPKNIRDHLRISQFQHFWVLVLFALQSRPTDWHATNTPSRVKYTRCRELRNTPTRH
jgi:hypothetical protein